MIIKTRRKDVITNYLNIIVSLCSNIVLLPVLVHFMDTDILGLWYIFLSIGGIVSLFDFGFNPAIARVVSYSWCGSKNLKKTDVQIVEKNTKTNYELLFFIIKTCKRVYLFISIIALFLMMTIGTWYISKISANIINMEIYLSWIIYSISIFLNLYIGYYSMLLRGIGDVHRQSLASIISKSISVSIMIISLLMGANILGLAIANLISGIILRYLNIYFFYEKNNIRVYFSKIVFSNKYSIRYVFDSIWYNTWRDGVVYISMYLNSQANVILCSMFLTLEETGIYSLCLQIISALTAIATAGYSSCQPSLQAAYMNNNKLLAKNLFAKAIFVYYFIFIIGTICFIIIGTPIIEYIKKSFIINPMVYLLMSINMFLINRHITSASFIANTNKIPYVKSFIISSICSVFLSIIFFVFLNIGIYSLILAPLIVQSLYNNWKWNTMVNTYLNINEYNLILLGIKELKL